LLAVIKGYPEDRLPPGATGKNYLVDVPFTPILYHFLDVLTFEERHGSSILSSSVHQNVSN